MGKLNKNILLVLILVIIVGVIGYLESLRPDRATIIEDSAIQTMSSKEKAALYEEAKEITTPNGFINTDEITIQELIGKKVVLIDIWTYSCINCQRTLPYINDWYEKYKDEGLEIIGLHTPEFKFEHKYENVVAAVERFGVKHPVVLDNDFSTWTAYNNRYWPRKYLIDIDGYIVYDHIGEGGYEETEAKIQALLKERKQVLGEGGSVTKDMTDLSIGEEVDFTNPRSPETYFGSARNERLGNGLRSRSGIQILKEPSNLEAHVLYLDGEWNLDQESAENLGPGKIIFRYQGEKVFLVARSEEGVKVKILRDGIPVTSERGEHVDENGEVFIQNDQLYRLVEDPEGWGEHTLEIIIEEPGVQAFAFTFG